MTYMNVQELTQGDVVSISEVAEELELDFKVSEGETAEVVTVSVEGEEIYVTTDKGTFSAEPNFTVAVTN